LRKESRLLVTEGPERSDQAPERAAPRGLASGAGAGGRLRAEGLMIPHI
jgi:hypothetical protein